MKLTVYKTGRPALDGIAELVADYVKRCRPSCPTESIVVKDLSELKKAAAGRDYAKSGLRAALGPQTCLIALDETGDQWSSIELAQLLKKKIDDPGVKSLIFVIGGPYGLDDETRQAANHLWSLSHLTLQGDLAWLVTWEQIYRAMQINLGTGYHH